MKRLVFIALAASSFAFGQQTLVKKDGSKISVGDVYVHTSKKQIEFKSNGKEGKVKFADLDSAIIDNKVFKSFEIGKKARLYYVLTSSKGKILGITSSKRARDRGGFSSVVTLYETVVIENGKLLQELKFTESKTEEEVKKRREFFDMANRHFGDCQAFIQRLSLFADDSEHLILLNLLNNPEKVSCK